jgi:hypothetical protein
LAAGLTCGFAAGLAAAALAAGLAAAASRRQAWLPRRLRLCHRLGGRLRGRCGLGRWCGLGAAALIEALVGNIETGALSAFLLGQVWSWIFQSNK